MRPAATTLFDLDDDLGPSLLQRAFAETVDPAVAARRQATPASPQSAATLSSQTAARDDSNGVPPHLATTPLSPTFTIRTQSDLAPATPRARIDANLAALRTLRTLQAEQRPATPKEQAVLARWGGWGASGVAQVFDEDKPQYKDVRAELRDLLSDAEYNAARRTIINAHYTDASIVQSVWQAVQDLGFTGGRVLEPGCGAGTFIGLAPASAQMIGVELDPITAGIAQALYPAAHVQAESFADTRYPSGHFDLAIGNVPFADIVLHDPRYNSARLAMHNHFIVKSLDMVRPGGMVAVLTSRYTMDSDNPAARREINARADLVAAVRLPSGAHHRAAGTEAVTDLLILRKREPGTRPMATSWETTTAAELESPRGLETTRISQYWLDHPDRVLGSQRLEVGLHGILGVTVRGNPERAAEDLSATLRDAVRQASERGLVFTERTAEQAKQAAGWVAAATDAIDGQVSSHADGTFSVATEGAQLPLTIPKTQAAEVRALIQLRDESRQLIVAEAADLDDSPQLDELRSQMAGHWRAYVDSYGPINRVTLRSTGRVDADTGETIQARITPPAVRVLRTDPSAALLWGLEVFDEVTGTAEPAALLRHRVVVPRQPVRGVDNAFDGLSVVLDTVGRVDLEAIANLTGTDTTAVVNELGESIFQVPGAEEWQTRAEYLSGNVRTKLNEARLAEFEAPGRWPRNIAALQSVMPIDLQSGDLSPRIGAVWIPASDHQQFLRETLNLGSARVDHVPGVGWAVENASWGVLATEEWGTSRMDAGTIFEHLAKQRPIVIYDTNPDKTRTYNAVASAGAIEKGRLLQERFAQWVWEDPERTDRLVTEYNRRFNSLVERSYAAEGDRLTLPGLAKSFTPHAHQKAAVARMIAEPSVGLFHEVGAGKTAEMVMGLSELKRLGLVTKPCVVIPNHMLEQFGREWLQLYPQARILAASSDDLTADKRRQFVARAATGDWDGIIMTRSAFERLPLNPENEAAFQADELAEAMIRLENAKKANGGSRSLRSMEKALVRRQEAIKEARAMPADRGLTFEETGIDYLCIDELHGYKNLVTVSEIPDACITGSKRAFDLFAKASYLRRTTDSGRVMCGATATPIANSIAELHVMHRYLNPQGLVDAGLEQFDAWAATFGEVVTAPEVTVAGGLKLKARFARFNNIPELRTMFSMFGDVKTAADLNLPRPLIAANADGERTSNVILVPASEDLSDYMKTLGQRAKDVEDRRVRPDEDNMLKIGSDGRKAALDLRLLDAINGYQPGCKLDAAVDELHKVWLATRDNMYADPITGETSTHKGALQIVFCDLSTPNSDRWDAYNEIRDQLVARGMDRGRIRFIHEAKNDAEKARMFEACRTGGVDIIIGSTEKMGTGTNIQARAIHLMNLDAPWRPADVEQRIGRAIRQGNQNPEVAISHVVTEGSFDTFMWQTLSRKQRFIEQVMTGRGTGRSAEGDIEGGTLPTNYNEIMAASSGNPLIFELATAQQELTRLTRLERAHAESQRSLGRRRSYAEAGMADARATIPRLEAAVAQMAPTAGDAFRLTGTRGDVYDNRERAAEALNRSARIGAVPTPICTLGGHKIQGHHFRNPLTYDTHIEFTVDGVSEVSSARGLKYGESFAFTSGVVLQMEHMVERIPKRLHEAQLQLAQLEDTIKQSERR